MGAFEVSTQHDFDRAQHEGVVDSQEAEPQGTRPRWRKRDLLPWILMALAAVLSSLLVAEARTSRIQSQELSRYAATLTFALGAGATDQVAFPKQGPFDTRLGYTQLPAFQQRLLERGFAVDRQARFSPALMDYTQHGFYPPYHEKTRAGLTIQECRGEPLYTFRHPQRHYPHFDAVPPRILQALLFIENRELLNDAQPYANPAVDWPRFAMAAVSQVGKALELQDQSAGGSTLATQVEKYRHSPDGLTRSASDKLRQMISASVRSYQDGPNTLGARQDVALDYLNTVPLSAAPGYGEVHGIGDGLWVWFGADFDEVNRLLVSGSSDLHALPQQGLALRQVVALMIAQRRPSYYLSQGRQALEQLTDSHLRLFTEAGIVDAALRDAALEQRLTFRHFAQDPASVTIESDKGIQVARSRLAGLLGLPFYDLDRLDLTATTTLHGELQHQISAYLDRLADPAFAKEIGLLGDRLLSPEKTQDVRYSFTLFERRPDGLHVRVQTDNTQQPFDINEGSKLELGSTAKLRVLATYLEVMAELHARYADQPIDVLRQHAATQPDALTRWVIEYLSASEDRDLVRMLQAAMERRYSASPNEGFFTGGGRHTFNNFRREDNGRNPTLNESLRESINLPFVRVMRDLVRYTTHANDNGAQLLEDDNDPRRVAYLQRFAEREGRVFLMRFWNKYRDQDSDQRLETFLEGIQPIDSRLATVHRYLFPNATRSEFAGFLAQRLPNLALSDKRIDELYSHYAPEAFPLTDQGYIARVHPLELWLVGYMLNHPEARFQEAAEASQGERQEVYGWLFKTRHRNARDVRIRTMLEVEAFLDIHQRWARLGYPFDHLVPSLATALGSSGDRPAALAELMGIILNEGIRLPTQRIDMLHFAEGTPYETRMRRSDQPGKRVMAPEVARVLREALSHVVEGGTARRLQGSFTLADGTPLVLGGKTGTGDNRIESVSRSGQVIDSQARNRTATFVFYLGDHHFGTLTAYVIGSQSGSFRFTSALPVQVLKGMEPILRPHLDLLGPTACGTPTPGLQLSAG
ncbi:transglycosylase domain-containing protein [Litchfieldella xinjiangensis]|uniref:transglycosylase domain-containing protein n=1 Tax=Litchfieldella xinjiangensis TaxID=1166948 RepID=UPI0009DCED33|nr:transglycosylase domain-containing protein [Halomonas xinjiangensis]